MDSGSSSSHSRWGSSGSLSGDSSSSTRSTSGHRNQFQLRLPSNALDSSYSSHYDSDHFGDLPRHSRSPQSNSPVLHERRGYMHEQQQQLRYPPPSFSTPRFSGVENMNQNHELQRLRTENLMLRAQNETLQSNFNSLLSSLSKATSSSTTTLSSALPPVVTLQQADFPRSTYWQKKTFTDKITHDAGRNSRSKITKNSLLFITNEKGATPTPETLEDIRKFSYSLFFECEQEGILPPTWTQAGHGFIHRFRATLEEVFPDLRLCDGHWKVDRLGSKVYAAWCGTHRKKIKVEHNSDDDGGGDEGDNDDVVVPQKRAASVHSHSAEPASKRPKPNSSASSSERPLTRTQDNQKRKIKNPLLNKTPATVATTAPSASTSTTLSTLPATSNSLAAPSPPTATSNPLTALPLTTATTSDPLPAPSPTTATADMLAAPDPTTATSNPLPAPSPSASITLAPSVHTVGPIAPPESSGAPQPAAPNPGRGSTSLAPAPQPKAWKPTQNSTTPKGQAAFAYKTDNPAATKDEFEDYFKNLSTAAKEAFKVKASAIKAGKDAEKATKAIAKAAKTQAAQGK
ncbi:hypothetical protein B0H16DRAFT_1899142, partial [Mycena metata]